MNKSLSKHKPNVLHYYFIQGQLIMRNKTFTHLSVQKTVQERQKEPLQSSEEVGDVQMCEQVGLVVGLLGDHFYEVDETQQWQQNDGSLHRFPGGSSKPMQGQPQIGSDWPKMGHIWDFLRSVSDILAQLTSVGSSGFHHFTCVIGFKWTFPFPYLNLQQRCKLCNISSMPNSTHLCIFIEK